MRPDIFLATIGRGSNGSNALEVTEDRAAVTAESQDNIINRVNNISQYGPSWHYVPGIGVAGTAYVEVPGSALGDLAFTRASSKTRTNSAGVVETIDSNVPPHDYRNADGTLSTFPRSNLEPQRTNSIRNSSMVGAVAGSPGTLPTNWANVNLYGLSRTVVAIGTENGLPYIDFRFNGTANTTENLRIDLETTTSITASNGQAWSLSTYAKTISGTTPTSQFFIVERTSAGAFITQGATSFVPTSTLTRFSATRTLSGGATVGAVQPLLMFAVTSGVSYDFTIRIAAPQMELGAFATTWVPTTTAAVTRLADAASKAGVSSLIGQTEGTFYTEIQITPGASRALFSIDIGATGNYILGSINGSAQVLFRVNQASTVTTLVTSSALTLGRHKLAFAYKAGQYALYIDGVQVGTSTSTAYPVGTLSQIILSSAGFGQLGDGYASAALFTTRLTNAQLAQMTTL